MELEENIEIPSSSFLSKTKFLKNKSFVFGFGILLFLLILALFGPYFNPYTYFDTHLNLKNTAPNLEFWFGTDELGRDIFTRVCFGARISLTIGFSAAFINAIIGIIYGSVSALIGNITDEIMMRVCDIIATIPYLLTVILLTTFIGSGIFSILISLTLIGWINMARIIRAQILSLKKMPFISAAKMLGATNLRIIFKHLLPNCIGCIITNITISIPLAVFTESFLSFLGLGIQAPSSSWGVMINDGLYAIHYYPWRIFFPSFMISLTIFAFNLLGEGIRDIFEKKEVQ